MKNFSVRLKKINNATKKSHLDAKKAKISYLIKKEHLTALTSLVKTTYKLKSIEIEPQIEIEEAIACLEKLMYSRSLLDNKLENLQLSIGSNYNSWKYGRVVIPHDFELY